MGDSTTAGTPGFKSPVEAPPERARRRDEPVRLLVDAGAPGVGGPESRRQRRAQRSDPRRGSSATSSRPRPAAVVIIAGVNDVYQGRAGRARDGAAAAMYSARRAGRHPGRRRHRSSRTTPRRPNRTRGCARSTRGSGSSPGRRVRRYPRRGRGGRTTPTGSSSLRTACIPRPPGYRRMADAIRPVLERVICLGRVSLVGQPASGARVAAGMARTPSSCEHGRVLWRRPQERSNIEVFQPVRGTLSALSPECLFEHSLRPRRRYARHDPRRRRHASSASHATRSPMYVTVTDSTSGWSRPGEGRLRGLRQRQAADADDLRQQAAADHRRRDARHERQHDARARSGEAGRGAVPDPHAAGRRARSARSTTRSSSLPDGEFTSDRDG